MAITLFAQQEFPAAAVVAALRCEGVTAKSVQLEMRRRTNAPVKAGGTAALISSELGTVSIGEQTDVVRKQIGPTAKLILCAPQQTESDHQLLITCGASVVITPSSWAPLRVAERILAELILDGSVQPSTCGALRGATQQIRELYAHIERLAPLDEPILILGETGTGKELVAGELHRLSRRHAEQLLAINCAELTPELMGSELFGHAPGAFTDARQARKGLLTEAGKGTVFLDEIGDLDLKAQAKLLRVLEERKVRPVGADRWHDFHARVVLATHRNLEEACAAGRFRQDLYERIGGFTLRLPPLRERRADIPSLAHYFVEEYARNYKTSLTVPLGALDCLFQSEWRGNVRALRALVRKAAAYADQAGNISVAVLEESTRRKEPLRSSNTLTFDPATENWRDFQHRAQASYFRAVLAKAGGSKSAAAKLAGLSRSQFYEILNSIEQAERDSNTAGVSSPES